MRKFLILLSVPLFLLLVDPAAAEEVLQEEITEDSEELPSEDITETVDNAEALIVEEPEEVMSLIERLRISLDEVKSKRSALKHSIEQAADREEKAKLVREDNQLAGYETAYKKAIEIEQGGSITIQTSNRSYNFESVSLIPGQAAPGSYIPIYKAAAAEYNVHWNTLAAIHKVETNYSTHPTMVSYAGATGHMQFMPATFDYYGVDANGNGIASPWEIEDAIFSAAHYLSAMGYSKDVRKAIWHYNHADWYVDLVIETSRQIQE